MYILNTQPTYDKAEELIDLMNDVFNMPTSIAIPETLELLDEQLNTMQVFVSSLMILFAVFNCMLCYKYIYSTSKETLRIMRVCGATKTYCKGIYIAEISLHILLCFSVAYLLFNNIVLKIATNHYEGIEVAYNTSNYAFILLAYAVISLLISIFTVLPFASEQMTKHQQ